MGTPFYAVSDEVYIDSLQNTLTGVHVFGFRPNQLIRHYLRVDSTPCLTTSIWPNINLLHNSLRIILSMRDSTWLSGDRNILLHQTYQLKVYEPGDVTLTGPVVKVWDSVCFRYVQDRTPILYYDIDLTNLMQGWIDSSYFNVDTVVYFTLQNNNATYVPLNFYYTAGINDTDIDVSAKMEYAFEINKSITQCLTTSGANTDNPVKFQWGDCCPSPNYQIQVLRLYNIDSGMAYDPTTVKAVIDWSQALSLETNNRDTSIRLTLAEGSGYYVWRVRRIYDIYPNGIGDDRNWGDWTTYSPFIDGDTVNVTSASINSYVFYYQQFDSMLNWVYHRQFVEGEINHGSQTRMGEKTTYANYLLMPIQEQVRSQSEDTVMASQIIPDNNGRPTFQTLPAPAQKHGFGYELNFVTDQYSMPYTEAAFDADSTVTSPHTVNDTCKLGQYYSDLNPDSLVASALGYPFSRTLYGNDNQNRPYMITTPGAYHTFSSNHQIQKYYGKSTPTELIRVLGDEAPKAESVVKNCTIDPNGVVNVAYIDEAGRTLITCLSGPPAGAQDTFDYQPFTVYDTIRSKMHQGTGWIERATYAITTPTSMSYLYQIIPKVFTDQCDSICSTCDYIVHLYAQNRIDTGLSYTDSIIITPTTDTTGAMSCSGTTYSINSNYSPGGNVTLSPGTWDLMLNIQPNNIDPITGIPYIDEISMRIQSKIQFNIDNEEWKVDNGNQHVTLGQVRTYLNSNDINGLITYLQADTTNGYFTMRAGCDTMSLPTAHCPPHDCSNMQFAEYMISYLHQYDTGHNITFYASITDLKQTTSARRNQDTVFSNAQFDTLITNMINDGYNCDTMWEAWESTVASYAITQVAAALPSTTFGSSVIRVDWWNDFMNRVGYKFPLKKCDTIELYHPLAPYPHIRDSAYRYFPYNFGNRPSLENAFFITYAQLYGLPPTLPFTTYGWYDSLYNFPVKPIDSTYHVFSFWQAVKGLTNYYQNLANTLPVINNTNNPTQMYAQMELDCMNACDDRLGVLLSEIVDNCNDQLFAVQTYNYPAWFSPATDTVALDKVYCIANSIIAKCKEGCMLTPDSSGAISGTDLTDYQHSLVYAIEVQVHPNTLTPTCDTDFIPVYPDTTYISTTGLVQWLNNRGGQLHDSLSTAGYGPAWSWQPFQAAVSGDLAASSYNCDVNQVVDLHGSDHREWYSLGQVQSASSACTTLYCKQVYPDYALTGSIFDVEIDVTPVGAPLAANDSIVILAPVDLTHDSLYFTLGTYSAGVQRYSIIGPHVIGDTIRFFYKLRATSAGVITYPTINVHRYHLTSDSVCVMSDLSTVVANCIPLNYDRIDSTNTYVPQAICAGVNAVCGNAGNCGSACIKWVDPTYISDTIPGDTLHVITCGEYACSGFLLSLDQQITGIIAAHDAALRAEYSTKCINDTSIEDLFVNSFSLSQYMYTLFYYDRASNLVRTVSPKGVVENITSRASTPAHKYVSMYNFNTLGQVQAQQTPDAGATVFYYDSAGKIRLSQNANQKYYSKVDTNIFSYTKYDSLSRVIETGEVYLYTLFNKDSLNEMKFPTEDAYKHLHYITRTVYSDTCPKILPAYNKKYIGDNILNRISYAVTERDGDWATTDDQVWSIYSYDLHGNVKDLVQYISPAQKAVHIGYEYDLVSNKVIGNFMTKLDSINHPHLGEDYYSQWYSYDGDKRLTKVQSNYHYDTFRTDTWLPEASYSYYLHGPLKRTVLGANLQGIDYRYTLEGWLKAINGHPGRYEPTADTTAWRPDTFIRCWAPSGVPRDLYTEILGYYHGDYVRANSVLDVDSIMLYGDGLYNGNISSKMEASPNYEYYASLYENSPIDEAWGYTYHYDQLNRLKYSHTSLFHTRDDTTYAGWVSATPHGCAPDTAQQGIWDEHFTYDKNGNIVTLGRNALDTCTSGRMSWTKLDTLGYVLDTFGNPYTNKLAQLYDWAGFKHRADLGFGTYTYDKIGELIWDRGDSTFNILNIFWTPYGKVDHVHRYGSYIIHIPENSAHTIDAHDSTAFTYSGSSWYLYDAAGNRVREYTYNGAGEPVPPDSNMMPANVYDEPIFSGDSVTPVGGLSDKYALSTKYNIYEASGTLLANYRRKAWLADAVYDWIWDPVLNDTTMEDSMQVTDRYLYGSERLATIKGLNQVILKDSDRIDIHNVPSIYAPAIGRIGSKFYELHDHLGNVKTIFQDIFYDQYHALSRYNYYAFGSLQPGNWKEQQFYNQGYNGKLRDDKWKNEGDILNYGARQYDSRIGRWINTDPLFAKYPGISPYVSLADNPIYYKDLDGREIFAYNAAEQQLWLNTMAYMFGRANGFEFIDNKLQFTGSTAKFNCDQKLIFDYFSKTVLTSSTAYTIHLNTNTLEIAGTPQFAYPSQPATKMIAEYGAQTFYFPSYKRWNMDPQEWSPGEYVPMMVEARKAHIETIISTRATTDGIHLQTVRNTDEKFPTEHVLAHEIGHAIMAIILNELGGSFEGVNYGNMSSTQQKDFSIKFTNTILDSRYEKEKTETGAGQHERGVQTDAPKKDVSPMINEDCK